MSDIPILVNANKEEWAALKEQSIFIEVLMTIDGEEFRQGFTVKPEEHGNYKDCQLHTEKMLNQIGRTFANVIIHRKFKEEIK